MSSVLITGASKGIGRAVAVELAGGGHQVVATARRPEALADLPVDQRLRLDVTDQDNVDRAIAEAGEIDVLVSNAGATVRAPLESVPLAEVERLYQLNTLGALRVAQAVLPPMRKRGSGRLVFVSSTQGRLVLLRRQGEHRAAGRGVHERCRAGPDVRQGGRPVRAAVPAAQRSAGRGRHS
jgi:NADP-dependent 3-hydroxy acid dehydrogenase YdfG